jgi:hypothetical protein
VVSTVLIKTSAFLLGAYLPLQVNAAPPVPSVPVTSAPVTSAPVASASARTAPTTVASSSTAVSATSASVPVGASEPESPSAVQPVLDRPAALDYGPRNAQERELCERGSSPDWLYLAGLLALNAGSIALDRAFFSQIDSPKLPDGKDDLFAPFDKSHSAVRSVGPALIGLTIGATLPGVYMSLPTCDKTWLQSSHPAEGRVRNYTPLMIALTLTSIALAPITVAIQSGPEQFGVATNRYPTTEKSFRVILPMITGLIGALLPHVPFLAPRTWRAAWALDDLHLGVAPVVTQGTTSGASLSFGRSF